MDNNQLIQEKLLDMRRELVSLQDIADKDNSVAFGVFLDLHRIIAQIDYLFYYNFKVENHNGQEKIY